MRNLYKKKSGVYYRHLGNGIGVVGLKLTSVNVLYENVTVKEAIAKYKNEYPSEEEVKIPVEGSIFNTVNDYSYTVKVFSTSDETKF